MTRLYKRRATLTIARPVPNSFFTLESNAIVILDLRVVFNIQKSLESQPNTAEILVNNLAEHTRAAIQDKPIHVRLDVGYDDNESRLFTGDLLYSSSRKASADWETIMQVSDGGRAHRYARVSRSFKSGINVKDALSATANSMGLKLPTSVDEAKSLFDTFSSGLSLEGPSEKELTRLLAPKGMDWSIQDGKLQILGKNDVRKDQAIVVSEDTGMIGSPESAAPKNPGEPSILSVSLLLDPRLVPGVKMQVESRLISGLFRVDRVTHTGDTHGAEWTTKVEAKPV